MKIIHCADIHVDSKLETHFSKEGAAAVRRGIIETFADMVDYAKKNGVRVITIAGDLFDTKTSEQKTIKKRIQYIIGQNPQIDFLYLRGNHDEDVEFASEEDLPNLKRFCKGKWTRYSYEGVDFYGREFSKNIPAAVYDELDTDGSKFNFVLMHGQVVEYKAKDGAPTISLKELANRNIDYLALGHIHECKIGKLDARGFWAYSGCLCGRGFDECGDKGFILLDTEAERGRCNLIAVAKRKVHSVEVPLSGEPTYSQVMEKINFALEGIFSEDIVEVVLTGAVDEGADIESEAYEEALAGKYFFIRVKNKTQNKIDFAKYKNDVSLKGEFIRLVQSQKDLSNEEKSQIIITGIKALAGRE